MRLALKPNQFASHPKLKAALEKIVEWASHGCTPRQLAFTLALGFAIGCVPLLGVTSGVCALLALGLRLNMPAIQAANWVAMPFQVLLIFPFMKIGQWMFSTGPVSVNRNQLLTQIHDAPFQVLEQMSSLFGHALLAWLILAVPALLLLTPVLTSLLKRVPFRATAQTN